MPYGVNTKYYIVYDYENPEKCRFNAYCLEGRKRRIIDVNGRLVIRDFPSEFGYDIKDGKLTISNPLTGREDEYDMPIVLGKVCDLALWESPGTPARFDYESFVNSIKNDKYSDRYFVKNKSRLRDEIRDCEKWKLSCGEFSFDMYVCHGKYIYVRYGKIKIDIKWSEDERFVPVTTLAVTPQKPLVQEPEVLDTTDVSSDDEPTNMSKDENRLEIEQKVIEIVEEPHRESPREELKAEQPDFREEKRERKYRPPTPPTVDYSQFIEQVPETIPHEEECIKEYIRDCYESVGLMTYNPKTHRMEKMSYAEFLKLMNKKK